MEPGDIFLIIGVTYCVLTMGLILIKYCLFLRETRFRPTPWVMTRAEAEGAV